MPQKIITTLNSNLLAHGEATGGQHSILNNTHQEYRCSDGLQVQFAIATRCHSLIFVRVVVRIFLSLIRSLLPLPFNNQSETDNLNQNIANKLSKQVRNIPTYPF